MKICASTGLAVLMLLRVLPAAEREPWRWQDARVPDLGFDLDAAKVLRVTSLAATGEGSLREALKVSGPRIIVFEVEGVIDLDLHGLDMIEPNLIVAGQTAPSPGITLIRGGLRIRSAHTLIQHLKVRPGDADQPKAQGWEPDGMTTSGGPVDVWVDHCSCTWAVDENLSATTFKSPTGESARRIHLRDCLIAEGLDHATHHKVRHSKGTLIDNSTQEVAVVRCLYASNVERNPVVHTGCSAVIVNTVIANPGERAIHSHPPAEGKNVNLPLARISIVGNVVLFGERTKKTAAVFEGRADAFFKDNEGYDWQGARLPELRQSFETLKEPPLWPEGLRAVSPTAALWHVARFVGARPAERDAIDRRIVSEALTGTARIIDSQEQVGGYPKIEPVTRKLEVPEKNRRAWLEKLAQEVELGPGSTDMIRGPKESANQ
jgi:hypothetical protein